MKSAVALVLSVILVGLSPTSTLAHPVTFKGTVALATAAGISVNVKDEKTGKTIVENFQIDKETKILRGDNLVTFAAARIQKGEQVSVTVNLDDGGDIAEVIRLPIAIR